MAKAITLLESTKLAHRAQADELLQLLQLHPKPKTSLRLGVSGVPGVGKSTFIEALGLALIEQGQSVAVLAVDPSSSLSGGSILGDKTRMERLSVNEHAFIRPSPSSGNLGGVCEKTRECMLICEYAGFEVIMVETVGVGQSEVAVANMTDVFLLLHLPNSGDDLQAMKKGVMEFADFVVINKADLDPDAATRAQSMMASAMRLAAQSRGGSYGAQGQGKESGSSMNKNAMSSLALQDVDPAVWARMSPEDLAAHGLVSTHGQDQDPVQDRVQGPAKVLSESPPQSQLASPQGPMNSMNPLNPMEHYLGHAPLGAPIPSSALSGASDSPGSRASSRPASSATSSPHQDPTWRVLQISALQHTGLDDLIERLQRFHLEQMRTHAFENKRAEQAVSWLWERIHSGLRHAFMDNLDVKNALDLVVQQVSSGALDASIAARRLLALHQK